MESPTTSSTGFPATIAPAPPSLASKIATTVNMAAIASNAAVLVPSIGPTKTWVIPPRPKPGRKPATDTPPTKRKAQNRAAQRAFRERRAARVGELEEQLKETEEERQKRESAMHDQIDEQNGEILRLEEELQRTSADTNIWRDRCLELEQNLEHERQEKDAALVELAYLRNGTRSTGTDAVPLPPRRPQNQRKVQSAPISQYTNSGAIVDPFGCGNCTNSGNCLCVETALAISTSGCGKCTPANHCECLEETLRGSTFDNTFPADLKRPPSGSHNLYDIKRPRFSVEQFPQQEIDFTAQFSQAKQSSAQDGVTQDHSITLMGSRPSAEICGFCTEETYCVCADAAGAISGQIERDNENRLAPMLNEVTPPPSDTDITLPDNTSLKLPSLHPNHWVHHPLQSGAASVLPVLPRLIVTSTKISQPPPDSCTRAPGSCKQCQEDPKSGLFCRSLAAMRASDSGISQSPRGCCKDQTPTPSLSLSCADTYKTLASHKNFDRASDDISTWLPKLQTSQSRYPGRAPLDIEAASVMNVIKYFDVRFGCE